MGGRPDYSTELLASALDVILAATNAKPAGRDRWMGLCPVHGDRKPSLSIALGNGDRLLIHCFAGCELADITAAIGLELRDLFASADRVSYRPPPPRQAPDTERVNVWQREWERAKLNHPVLERYLKARGLTLQPPPSLRIGYFGDKPYMAARVEDITGNLVGLHRTFLEPDGSARIDKRLAAGSRVRGAAIRLFDASERLAIAEGIETGLAVHQLTAWPVWAAISAAGMKALELPEAVREVLVCADHDEAGIDAAYCLARRLAAEGRHVRVSVPPKPGADWLDLLVEVTA